MFFTSSSLARNMKGFKFSSLSLPSGSPTFGCDEAYRSVPFLPAPCSTAAAAELAYISIVLLDEFSLIPSLMPPYYVRTRRHTDRKRDSASSFNNDNCTTYTTDAMQCFPSLVVETEEKM